MAAIKWLLALPVALPAFIAHQAYQRLRWIDVAAHIHASRGAINCGHAHSVETANAAVSCASSAQQQGKPFLVTFTAPGTDAQFSSTLVGDAEGHAIEVFYSTGMIVDPNTLLTRRCPEPIQLQVEAKYWGLPMLHCAPWPPSQIERDHLLW